MPDQYLIDRYRDRLLGLLPPGDAFSRSPDSVLYDVCDRVAIEFARVDERVSELLVESIPSRCTELLDDWEAALGLPDDCYSPTSTEERRAAIVSRLVGTGGNSLADYTALAAALGYSAPTFTTYPAFLSGRGRSGDRITNGPWRSTAMVSIAPGAFDALLECAFLHQKLAHETLLFDFSRYLTVGGAYVTVGGSRVTV